MGKRAPPCRLSGDCAVTSCVYFRIMGTAVTLSTACPLPGQGTRHGHLLCHLCCVQHSDCARISQRSGSPWAICSGQQSHLASRTAQAHPLHVLMGKQAPRSGMVAQSPTAGRLSEGPAQVCSEFSCRPGCVLLLSCLPIMPVMNAEDERHFGICGGLSPSLTKSVS